MGLEPPYERAIGSQYTLRIPETWGLAKHGAACRSGGAALSPPGPHEAYRAMSVPWQLLEVSKPVIACLEISSESEDEAPPGTPGPKSPDKLGAITTAHPVFFLFCLHTWPGTLITWWETWKSSGAHR